MPANDIPTDDLARADVVTDDAARDHGAGADNAAGCLFCAIVAGRLPSSQLYADDVVLAFLDIRPVNTGHLLVVPRAHADGLGDLPERTGSAMFAAAHRLAKALRGSGLQCDGINFFLADGVVAGRRSTTSTCTWFRGSLRTASRSAPVGCHRTGRSLTRQPSASVLR